MVVMLLKQKEPPAHKKEEVAGWQGDRQQLRKCEGVGAWV